MSLEFSRDRKGGGEGDLRFFMVEFNRFKVIVRRVSVGSELGWVPWMDGAGSAGLFELFCFDLVA